MISEKFRHPWELSRTDIILSYIRHFQRGLSFIDIGAGDQYFTRFLSRYTPLPAYAVDVCYDHPQVNGSIIESNSVDKIPLKNIDCFVMMDCLEHIEDDGGFIKKISQGKAGARYLITVPAFQYLFSAHDEIMGHHRRYDRRGLRRVLERNGLMIIHIQYFYTSLLLFRIGGFVLEKLGLAKEKETATTKWKSPERNSSTQIFRFILNFDFFICMVMAKLKIYLPGLSLLAICEKVTGRGTIEV